MFEFSRCKVTNLYLFIEIFTVSLRFWYMLNYVTHPRLIIITICISVCKWSFQSDTSWNVKQIREKRRETIIAKYLVVCSIFPTFASINQNSI